MAKEAVKTVNQLDAEEARWFAVYTQYKREKLVRDRLSDKGVECYLPVRKVIRQWSKKRRTMELPLISCYIFVKITTAEYVPVLETEYVLKFVKFKRDLIAIPEKEIELIRSILQENIDFDIVPTERLQAGDTVEITGGNLAGARGQMVEVDGKNTVLITLEHLQHTFRLSIDRKLLRKARPL